MIDNLGTFVWQNRFRGHMSLSCHRNDIAEKNTSHYIHVICLHMFAQYVFFLQPKHVTSAPFYKNKKRSDWNLQVVAETLTFRDPSSCIHLSFRSQPASRIESH